MPKRLIPLSKKYVEGRVFEWCMALGMLGAGIECLFWPDSLAIGGVPTTFMLPSVIIGFLILVGWSRCAALMLNGQSVWGIKLGPYIRSFCGILSAALWAQFSVQLI